MQARRWMLVTVVAAGMCFAACGSDEGGVDATGSNTIAPPVATTPEADPSTPATEPADTTADTEPAVTEPAPTDAPTTDAPMTIPPTVPATTPAPSTWSVQPRIDFGSPAAYEENWYVPAASPDLPPDGATALSDGYYRATFAQSWSPDDPGALHLRVSRFVPCSIIGEPACYAEPWTDRDYGVDTSLEAPVLFPLDSSSTVSVLALTCDADDTDASKKIDGGGFAAWLPGLAAAYEGILAQFPDQDVYDITEQIAAGAAPGWTDTGECYWGIQWTAPTGDAPPILFQGLYAYEGEELTPILPDPRFPSYLLMPGVLEVSGGNMTIYLFAGFIS